ncbi:hypothetical protein [Paraflavitalea speifideaquila]|uniref:hypothetical protein n=1 Tax=Paraflavitalea speifideaquila TaxID=3076558 RepID=UPI0028E8091C|nr:hypothetical protein [Paraflavitalea speifideiaquila]
MKIKCSVRNGGLTALVAVMAAGIPAIGQEAKAGNNLPNLAIVATPSAAGRFGNSLDALNDGLTPPRQAITGAAATGHFPARNTGYNMNGQSR